MMTQVMKVDNEVFEMWIWKKLLRIPWTAKRLNVSVLHELCEKPNLFIAVIKSMLDYFGQICDMIKMNESDVGDVVFEILAKTVFKFLCFILFLIALSNPT